MFSRPSSKVCSILTKTHRSNTYQNPIFKSTQRSFPSSPSRFHHIYYYLKRFHPRKPMIIDNLPFFNSFFSIFKSLFPLQLPSHINIQSIRPLTSLNTTLYRSFTTFTCSNTPKPRGVHNIKPPFSQKPSSPNKLPTLSPLRSLTRPHLLTTSNRTIVNWILFHMRHNTKKGYTRTYKEYRFPGQRFHRGHQWAVFIYRDDIENFRYKSSQSTTPLSTSINTNPHPSLPHQLLSNGHIVTPNINTLPGKNLLGGTGKGPNMGDDVVVTSCLNTPIFEIPIVPGTAGVFDPEYIKLLAQGYSNDGSGKSTGTNDIVQEEGGKDGKDGRYENIGLALLKHSELLYTIINKAEQISIQHTAFSATALYDSYQLLEELHENISKLKNLTLLQKLQSLNYWLTLSRIRDFLGFELLRQKKLLKGITQLQYQIALENCIDGCRRDNGLGEGNSTSKNLTNDKDLLGNSTTMSEVSYQQSSDNESSPILPSPTENVSKSLSQTILSSIKSIFSPIIPILHYTPFFSRFLPTPSQFKNLFSESEDDNKNRENSPHSHPFGTYQQSLLIDQMLQSRALATKCEELYRVTYHWGLYQLNWNDPRFRMMFGNGDDGKNGTNTTKISNRRYPFGHRSSNGAGGNRGDLNGGDENDQNNFPHSSLVTMPIEYPISNPLPWHNLMEFRESYDNLLDEIRKNEFKKYKKINKDAYDYYLCSNNIPIPNCDDYDDCDDCEGYGFDFEMNNMNKVEEEREQDLIDGKNKIGNDKDQIIDSKNTSPKIFQPKLTHNFNPNSTSLIRATLPKFDLLIQQSKLKPIERLGMMKDSAYGMTPEAKGLFMYKFDSNDICTICDNSANNNNNNQSAENIVEEDANNTENTEKTNNILDKIPFLSSSLSSALSSSSHLSTLLPLELPPLHHQRFTLNPLQNNNMINISLVRESIITKMYQKQRTGQTDSNLIPNQQLEHQNHQSISNSNTNLARTQLLGGPNSAAVLLRLNYPVPTFKFPVDSQTKIL